MNSRAVALAAAIAAPFLLTSAVHAQSSQRTRDTTRVVQVWVNTNSDKYHCPGSQYYGKTKDGEFQREDEARANGFAPAGGRTCGPLPTSSIRVWVNTNSGVYHCPGAHYYGNTKEGEYLSEPEALAAGFRPSNNKKCGS